MTTAVKSPGYSGHRWLCQAHRVADLKRPQLSPASPGDPAGANSKGQEAGGKTIPQARAPSPGSLNRWDQTRVNFSFSLLLSWGSEVCGRPSVKEPARVTNEGKHTPASLRRNRDTPDLMKPESSIPEELELVPSPKIDLRGGERKNAFLITNQIRTDRVELPWKEGALVTLKKALRAETG